jgi:hypothetical protein
VYLLEAHADDEWQDPDNAADGICYRKPRTLRQRISIARSFATDLKIHVNRVVVDSMENTVELAYDARPEKLVVVQNGTIVFTSGIGPYQYSTSKLASFLNEEVGGPTALCEACTLGSTLAVVVAAFAWWR